MLSRFTILSFAAYATAALNVTLCSDQECKEPALGSIRLDREGVGKCRNDFAGNAMAVKTSYWREPGQENATWQELERSLEGEDAPLLNVRFYSSVDCFAHCGTDHLLAQMWRDFKVSSPGSPRYSKMGQCIIRPYGLQSTPLYNHLSSSRSMRMSTTLRTDTVASDTATQTFSEAGCGSGNK